MKSPTYGETRFVRSQHLVLDPIEEGAIAHHSLYGYPTFLNLDAIRFLDAFSRPLNLREAEKVSSVNRADSWVAFFLRRHFLHPEGIDERLELQQVVDRAIAKILRARQLVSLGLIMDEGCNFNCAHCISKKLISVSSRRQTEKHRMTWATAQRAIDVFIEIVRARQLPQAEIYFGGSEPLLNWSLIVRVIEYCRNSADHVGLTFTFSSNSNASLVTPERAAFLARHNVTITTSLDGPLEVNDQSRVTRAGVGTYKRILVGWDRLGKAGQPITWFCLTLTDRNIEGIGGDFFDFLKERGITTCTFEPDLIEPLARPASEVVEALLRFKELGKERGISVGGLWDKPLKNMFEPNPRKKLFNCSAFTGRGVSVLPSGDVLLCAYSADVIGTIQDLPRLFALEIFRERIHEQAIGNIRECRGCEIEGQCMGGCAITAEYGRYTNSPAAFRYHCEIYRGATRALLRKSISANAR